LELAGTDRASFMQSLALDRRDEPPASAPASRKADEKSAEADSRPVIVVDPGHGGIDAGTQSAANGVAEKTIVLDFAKGLRERIEAGGKCRVVMTRDDDTFVPLAERVRIARQHNAALFISI